MVMTLKMVFQLEEQKYRSSQGEHQGNDLNHLVSKKDMDTSDQNLYNSNDDDGDDGEDGDDGDDGDGDDDDDDDT